MENRSPSTDLLAQAREMQGKLSVELKREEGELQNSAILGSLLSLGAFFALGLVLYLIIAILLAQFRIHDSFNLSLGMFFLFYPVVFVSLMLLAQTFEPKEEYYLGETWGGRLLDNPFTLRDDADRRHFALGFLLLIPNFVYLNIKNIKGYITNRNSAYSPTLAAAILIMAREKMGGDDMLHIMHPMGFRRSLVTSTLKFLNAVGWVEADMDESPPVFSLALRGEEILLECGWAYAPSPAGTPGAATPRENPE